MGKKALWTILCNLLIIHSVLCKKIDRKKPNRTKKELNLLPLYANLVNTDHVESKIKKKADAKNNNDKNDHDDSNKQYSSNSSSFLIIEDSAITKKKKNYPYLKKGKLYTPNTNNNKSEYVNNQLYAIKNAFIQNGKKKAAPKPTKQVPQAVTNGIEYISETDTHSNIVSQLSPHNAYVHYFAEMKHYIWNYQEIKNDYQNNIERKVKTYSDNVAKVTSQCSSHKNGLITLIKYLEEPERHKNQGTNYGNKQSEYKSKLKDYHNCIKNIHTNAYKDYVNIKSDLNKLLNKLNCNKHNCNTTRYDDMIKAHILKIDQFDHRKYNDFINTIKNIHTSSGDAIRKIKAELNVNLYTDITDFIIEEIKYIKEKYDQHLSKIKSASDNIKLYLRQNTQRLVNKNTLKDNFEKLAYYYSTFKFSTEHMSMLEKALTEKEKILYNSFAKFQTDLQNRATNLLNSEYTLSEVDSIITFSSESLKLAETVQESNQKIIDEYARYSNVEVSKVKTEYDKVVITLIGVIDQLKHYVNFIKEKVESTNSEKAEVANKLKDEKLKEMNQLQKAIAFLDIIETIKHNKEYSITERIKQIKFYEEYVKDAKKKIIELQKDVEARKDKLLKLIEDEKKNRIIKDEIKKEMEYIAKNRDNIQLIISKKAELDKSVLEIEQLIKVVHFGVEKFTSEKTKLQSNIKAKITELYKENLQTVVDNLSKFVDEHKNFYEKAYTSDDIDKLRKETKQKHEEVVKMKFDDITQIMAALETESKKLSELKKNIILDQSEGVKRDMSSELEKLNKQFNDLKESLNRYKEKKEKLEKYNVTINERKDTFLQTNKENDSETSDNTNIYSQIEKHKDAITNRQNTISNDINLMLESVKTANNKLNTSTDIIRKLEDHTKEKYSDTNTSLENFNTQITDIKVSEFQNEFIKLKESVSKTLGDIQTTIKNIKSIKALNAVINVSNKNMEDVEKIKDIKKELILKLDNHMNDIKNYKLVEESKKENLTKTLNEEKANVEKELSETEIGNLKEKISNILSYCDNTKKYISKDSAVNPDELSKNKTESDNIKPKIDNLNTKHKVLEKKIEDLIKEQHQKVLSWVNDLITKKDQEIKEKYQKNTDSINEMKRKLIPLLFSEDVKNIANTTIKDKIKTFEETVKNIEQKINSQNTKLSEIMNSYKQYMEIFNTEKDKKIHFEEKRSSMEEFFNKMEEITFKKLDEIEKDETTLTEVKKAELEYARILIHHAVQNIEKESAKGNDAVSQIEASTKQIDEIKQHTVEYQQKNANIIDYKEYYDKAKNNNKKINDIVNTAKEEKEKADKNENLSEIEKIKEQVNAKLQEAKSEYNSIMDMLAQIKKMKDLLILNNSKSISDEVLKNTQNAENIKNSTTNELKKIDDLVKTVVAMIDKAKTHKEKIIITLPDEQIDEEVHQIEEIKKEINTQKKELIKSYLSKMKEYKEKCTLEISNIKRAKNKMEVLKKNKENTQNNSIDNDIQKVSENFAKSEGYLKEVNDMEEKAKQNEKSLLEYEKNINDIFEESLILGIETKSVKKINAATDIRNNIEEEHSEMEERMKRFQEKLIKLQEKPNHGNVEHDLSNTISTNADVIIQTNIERAKHNLSEIEKIKIEVEKIIDKVKNSTSPLKLKTDMNEKKTLDQVKEEETNSAKYLSEMTTEKKLISAENEKLNDIESRIESIEKELEESKKNYEIGLLQKIKEISDAKKASIDSVKDSLNSILGNFSAIFNGSDLNEYEFNKYLKDYEQKWSEIKNEFNQHYNKIVENLAKASNNETNYNVAKTLRQESQQEKADIINLEKKANRYLNDVKKLESFRFILHMKEDLDKINTLIKEENINVNSGYENIKQLIEDIKKLDDENASSDKLQQATDKNTEVHKTMHSTYKIRAKSILDHISTSANFVDIKIVPKLPLSQLVEQPDLKDVEEIKFQPENEVKLETEYVEKDTKLTNVYENVKKAYNTVLEIFKHSKEIDQKQEECKKLIDIGKDIDNKLKLIKELINKVNIIKTKEPTISTRLDNSSTKLNQLEKIKCQDKSYDNIINENKKTELKNLSNVFNEQKSNTIDEQKLSKIKERFTNAINKLKSLEGEVLVLKASESVLENIKQKNTSIDEVHIETENIEKDIATLDTSFDELLKKGIECEVFRYTSLKDSLDTKMSENLTIIDDIYKKAHNHFKQIDSSYHSIGSDIRGFTTFLNTVELTQYESTNFEKSSKSSTELDNSFNESKDIVNNIKKNIIEYNEETEISTLEKNAEELEKLYNKLIDEKNKIKEIYEIAKIVKLDEIKSSAEKYIEIVEVFSKALSSQKSRIEENISSVTTLKGAINTKIEELVKVDNSFTLESIKAFDEIYSNIKTDIEKLEKLEKFNYNEHDNVKKNQEKITLLINRKNILTDYMNAYEEEETLNNKNENTQNEINNKIGNNKTIVSNLDDKLNKLSLNIGENDKMCSENYTNDFINQIMKVVNEVNARFIQNLPEKEKFFQIENNFNEIKDIENEIYRDYDVNAFIIKINEQIYNQESSVKNDKNVDNLKKAIQNVKNYNEETMVLLHKINSVLERIKLKKNEMDELFNSLSKSNQNAYETARRYINDSVEIVNKLNVHISNITVVLNNAETVAEELEKELGKLLYQQQANNASDVEENISPDAQREEETEPEAEEETISDTKSEEQEEDTDSYRVQRAETENHEAENEKSWHRRISSAKGEKERVLLAGAFILGLSICSAIFIAAKKKNDEEEEYDDDEMSNYDDDINLVDGFIMQDKEEAIEVCFDEFE
ncbi:reticulocyte binding protein [Plasmodium gonderi]|uniref:Reticulocyte binding protein n=1 Tax=Plasmodium gonderi TaxID=77519 RepID=A0A1Y1J9U5_PLAGO|nr:reticulocyte binding protein [Plasmodium gonderi]GAW79040.1 reticulocyte binding protein [Plasmodium gonderi]